MDEPRTGNPELGETVEAAGIRTNFHDFGEGSPLVLLHGSGPGVSAWANWRLNLPALGKDFRVVAPDIVGFGFTARPPSIEYGLDGWKRHLLGFIDALGFGKVGLVGNSFGGALALALAVSHPERVDRLVLMGSMGISFPLTEGLNAVWGYEPSVAAMREVLRLMTHEPNLVNDELVELRYHASVREDVQEAYAAMFPAPRQGAVDALTVSEDQICQLPHNTLIIHGRDDQVIPLKNAYRLVSLIDRAELHVFGRCGHWTQIEHAHRFNTLVANFFREAQR